MGEEIANEYYKDEILNTGVFPPELYVEVVNKEEVSAIMRYAYERDIRLSCRGAGTGLAEELPVNMVVSCCPLCV